MKSNQTLHAKLGLFGVRQKRRQPVLHHGWQRRMHRATRDPRDMAAFPVATLAVTPSAPAAAPRSPKCRGSRGARAAACAGAPRGCCSWSARRSCEGRWWRGWGQGKAQHLECPSLASVTWRRMLKPRNAGASSHDQLALQRALIRHIGQQVSRVLLGGALRYHTHGRAAAQHACSSEGWDGRRRGSRRRQQTKPTGSLAHLLGDEHRLPAQPAPAVQHLPRHCAGGAGAGLHSRRGAWRWAWARAARHRQKAGQQAARPACGRCRLHRSNY